MELKHIPLNDLHVQLGGKMTPFAGFNMPIQYAPVKEEHLTVRKGVGVFDVSHMGEFTLKGTNALNLIQWVTSNDASQIADGQAQYSCIPNNKGGIIDDLLVYRLSKVEYMLVVNAANIEKDWTWIKSQNRWGVNMENISQRTVLLAVQGPKAINTLQKLTNVDLATIKYYTFRKGTLAEKEMIISATGYTGSGGFELYIDKTHAKEVWHKIFEAGTAFSIKPIGLSARDTLRIEKGFCLYGNDLTEETSPLEAGLGWITKFTKDFVNAKHLKAQKEKGITRKLIGFIMIDKGIPRQGYPIADANGNKIGEVTSGTLSPSLNVGIGMGYVTINHSQPETEIYPIVRGKRLKAKVVKPPFIK